MACYKVFVDIDMEEIFDDFNSGDEDDSIRTFLVYVDASSPEEAIKAAREKARTKYRDDSIFDVYDATEIVAPSNLTTV